MFPIVTLLWSTVGLVVAMIMVLFINSLLIPEEEPMPQSPFLGFRLVFKRFRGQGLAEDRDEMSFCEAEHPYLTSAVNLTEMSPSGKAPVTENRRPGEQSTPLNLRPRAHSSHSLLHHHSSLPSSPTGSDGQHWHVHVPALDIIFQPDGEPSSHAAEGQSSSGPEGSSSLMTSTTLPPSYHKLSLQTARSTQQQESTRQPDTDDAYSVATSATLAPSYHTRRSEPDVTDYLPPLPRPPLLSRPWPSYHSGSPIRTPDAAPSGQSVSPRLGSEATERTRDQTETGSNQDIVHPRQSRDGGIRLGGGPLGDANTDGGARPPSYDLQVR